jgi:hypothetical protein
MWKTGKDSSRNWNRKSEKTVKVIWLALHDRERSVNNVLTLSILSCYFVYTNLKYHTVFSMCRRTTLEHHLSEQTNLVLYDLAMKAATSKPGFLVYPRSGTQGDWEMIMSSSIWMICTDISNINYDWRWKEGYAKSLTCSLNVYSNTRLGPSKIPTIYTVQLKKSKQIFLTLLDDISVLTKISLSKLIESAFVGTRQNKLPESCCDVASAKVYVMSGYVESHNWVVQYIRLTAVRPSVWV